MALKDQALILDATLGGGGHSEALLQRGARVVGVDQDEEALEAARSRLDSYSDRFLAMHANFRDMGAILDETGVRLDGLVFDLGVSSWQLDSADRGFSFRQDAPLDLRMDRTRGMTAAAFLAEAEEAELADVIWKYGQERASRKVARAIVARRETAPVETTFELSKVVEKVLPRRGRIHPATKVFQALRMRVNDELGALEGALEWIPRHLKPGGRVVVISFHSLEDALVKKWMRRLSREWIDRPEWSEPRRNPDCLMRQVFRRAITPSSEEVAGNPRSRSARLRVAERRAD
jgi:16S rRNA (cytosine1402-N4)-methyltransferase